MASRTTQLASRLSSAPSSPTLTSLQRRAAQAIRQNKRKRTRAEVQEAKREKWDIIQQKKGQNLGRKALIQNERRSRREDWELGHLAPNRALATAANPYGTIPSELSRGATVPKLWRRKEWGIEVGDRVVIVAKGHRDYGRIGKVERIVAESEEVAVERLNMANIAVAAWQLQGENDKTPFRAMALPLPLKDVRLVVPLIDSETGTAQDTVIEEMGFIAERYKNGVKIPKARYVETPTGRVDIPYPANEPVQPEFDNDTLRIEVEERSWTPTLSVPPMPPSVIDELRNKYSKFRQRHDDDWIAARDRETARQTAKLARMQARMITPLEELQKRKTAQKLAVGDPQLDEHLLASIGEIMARNLNLSERESSLESPAGVQRSMEN